MGMDNWLGCRAELLLWALVMYLRRRRGHDGMYGATLEWNHEVEHLNYLHRP